jgi:uncharacterized protein (TIGR01777 family)
MKVVLGGGSGYLGQALAASLDRDGHQVVVISRKPGEVGWDAVGSAVEGADAVVNLAGVSIGARRWTARRQEQIRSSRVDTNRKLAAAIEAAERKPGVFVTASGIDYYGDSGEALVDEASPAGDSFLARVCVDWEAAALGAPVRTVAVRTSLVVGPQAPAIRLMAIPFRLFAGGPVGGGRQWFPWISLDDLVGVYRRALDDPALEGPSTPWRPSSFASATRRGTLHRCSIALRRFRHPRSPSGSRSASRPTCSCTASTPCRGSSTASSSASGACDLRSRMRSARGRNPYTVVTVRLRARSDT